MPGKNEYVKFKYYEKKIKLGFMKILKVFQYLEIMGKKLNESYTDTYQKHIACSCGYKLIYVENTFSKTFKHDRRN